ncbi:MAG TPA: GH1 family beta-glucosidase [Patescibacteria group bacterium]|nr:GH1 family beta-glucosidase [Patescibacteria group bacterium]
MENSGSSGEQVFPAGFTWGAATSAYQIEGAIAEDGKGESIWDRFVRQPGRVARGERADVAADHYHRWPEDVRLIAALGLGAYRFSVAWARVLPEGRGMPNERGLGFYDRLVDGLLAAGVEPWLTVYHWDLPQALEDAGGWPRRDTALALAEYADVLARRLGDRVVRWMTVNEPWEIGVLGYLTGEHAPGRRSLRAALSAMHHVLLGHGLAASAIRASRPHAQIGIALDMVTCYADRDREPDRRAALIADGWFNRWLLDPVLRGQYPADLWAAFGSASPTIRPGDLEAISTRLDFVGLNYYYSAWIRDRAGRAPRSGEPLPFKIVSPHVTERTGLGWAVHPAGLRDALTRLSVEYGVRRLAVTESGAAYADRVVDGGVVDLDRARYHRSYLQATLEAMHAGAPVEAYFAWSLLDNFEWQHGFRPRFGLVRVDRRTQRRTVKASGRWFTAAVAANALVPLR